jgi:hypothetical protein
MRMEDGASRREHFQSAERQGIPIPEAKGPPLPELLRYLWGWFCDIHDGRTVNGMSATRASHLDVMAWQHNTGNVLSRWELKAIFALGTEWMSAQNNQKPNTAPKPGTR